MTTGGPHAAVAVDHVSDVAAGSSTVLNVVGDAWTNAAALMPVGSDAQQLLHVVGACLAVLVAAALLMRLLLLSRTLGAGYPAVTALPRLVTLPSLGSWSPPPLSPPTSSPVIRT
jgi:hypothetical protein